MEQYTGVVYTVFESLLNLGDGKRKDKNQELNKSTISNPFTERINNEGKKTFHFECDDETEIELNEEVDSIYSGWYVYYDGDDETEGDLVNCELYSNDGGLLFIGKWVEGGNEATVIIQLRKYFSE